MISSDRFEKVEIESIAELNKWLNKNTASKDSVWLVRFKKNVPEKYVDRLDVLDELLCFGWIDGLARALDDQRTMQLISKRKQQAWSQSYKARVERLILEGRMQPQGLAAIDRSKRDGKWDDYSEVDALVMPPDLKKALRANKKTYDFFNSTAPSYRRNVLRWIHSAKKTETREARVTKTVEFSSRGEKLPQM